MVAIIRLKIKQAFVWLSDMKFNQNPFITFEVETVRARTDGRKDEISFVCIVIVEAITSLQHVVLVSVITCA
jgi:hypothetical protein